MDRFFRLFVTLFVIFIVIFLAWRFSDIVAYILISAVLSFIGHPLVRVIDRIRFGKFKMPHVISTLITLIALIGIIVAFMSIFIPLIARQVEVISQIDFTQIHESIQEPLQSLEKLLLRYDIIPENETLESFLTSQIESLLNMATFKNFFSNIVGLTGTVFIGIFSVLFTTFFFLKDEHLFYKGIMLFVPSKFKDQTSKTLTSIRELLSRYFIGLSVELTAMITIIGLGLTILGVDNAFVIAFFGGVMNVIPYLGPIIGGAVGVMIGISTNLSLELYADILPVSLKIIGTFAFANLIDNMVLQPWIYSTSVRAHPLEIFLVILVAGSLAGVVGMILAIPGYTVLRIIAKQFLSKFEVVQRLTENI